MIKRLKRWWNRKQIKIDEETGKSILYSELKLPEKDMKDIAEKVAEARKEQQCDCGNLHRIIVGGKCSICGGSLKKEEQDEAQS